MPAIEDIDRYIMQANRDAASRPLPDFILGKNILSSKTGERLVSGKCYLQIAFNYDLQMINRILPKIPQDERILIEAGTPLIKRFGARAIEHIARLWPGQIVADIKTVDGAVMEVDEAYSAGATAATVIGGAPRETIDLFIERCNELGIDAMIDMINVEKPLRVLLPLRNKPKVVVLHRGRDEETTRGKVIKYKHINQIKSKYDVLISAAGGVDLKEARSAVFNGADIVVVNIVRPQDPWTGISSESEIEKIAKVFLTTIE